MIYTIDFNLGRISDGKKDQFNPTYYGPFGATQDIVRGHNIHKINPKIVIGILFLSRLV